MQRMPTQFLRNSELLVLRAIRKVIRISPVTPQLSIIDGEETNKLISQAIISNNPFLVARFGSIELSASQYHYILAKPLSERYKLYLRRGIQYIRKSSAHEKKLIDPLCNNAGFFPKDTSLLLPYSRLMQNDVRELDICGRCWGDESVFSELYTDNLKFSRLEDLEPYDYDNPWSKYLENKRVLVIHPFVESIKRQYSKRTLLWQNTDVLPNFTLLTIKAIQTIAENDSNFKDWFEALNSMKNTMDNIDYDVAIIGCGAYGLHLAAHAKRTGHVAIHLGGATQILFGIKGKRWDNIPAVSKFYNENWVRPLPEETPQNSHKVEDGCYW